MRLGAPIEFLCFTMQCSAKLLVYRVCSERKCSHFVRPSPLWHQLAGLARGDRESPRARGPLGSVGRRAVSFRTRRGNDPGSRCAPDGLRRPDINSRTCFSVFMFQFCECVLGRESWLRLGREGLKASVLRLRSIATRSSTSRQGCVRAERARRTANIVLAK